MPIEMDALRRWPFRQRRRPPDPDPPYAFDGGGLWLYKEPKLPQLELYSSSNADSPAEVRKYHKIPKVDTKNGKNLKI